MEFDIFGAISQVGFPIAVASYCLVVLNKTVAEHTKATLLLVEKFGQYEDRLKNMGREGGFPNGE